MLPNPKFEKSASEYAIASLRRVEPEPGGLESYVKLVGGRGLVLDRERQPQNGLISYQKQRRQCETVFWANFVTTSIARQKKLELKSVENKTAQVRSLLNVKP